MTTTDLMCPECDRGNLERKIAALTTKIRGESFTIEGEAMVCPQCTFRSVPKENMAQFALTVADAFRQAHDLLTSADLKKRRAMLGMTQQQFADYLGGVGVASVKRWELGQIQDQAMDELIRLKTDPEAAKRNLQTLEGQFPEQHILAIGDLELSFFSGQQKYDRKVPMKIDRSETLSIPDSDTPLAA